MADAYVHGYASEEQERLLSQAGHWREELILAGTTLAAGTRLLEIGCGVGAVLGILGESFPGVVLAGVDVAERQLEVARAHLAALGLEADLRRADALSLPYGDSSFEHVWMMWFLEHVDDPVGALQEAKRVLVLGGAVTAIEVDYNTVWASPTSDALEALFTAVARTMEASGRSDAGTLLAGWIAEAGFDSVDPGERRLRYSGAELARQIPYVTDVVESTLADTPASSDGRLARGLAALHALPATPDAAMGWTVHKAHAVR